MDKILGYAKAAVAGLAAALAAISPDLLVHSSVAGWLSVALTGLAAAGVVSWVPNKGYGLLPPAPVTAPPSTGTVVVAPGQPTTSSAPPAA